MSKQTFLIPNQSAQRAVMLDVWNLVSTLTADERAFFRDADPAGYILFGRNIETREQVRALTDDLRDWLVFFERPL